MPEINFPSHPVAQVRALLDFALSRTEELVDLPPVDLDLLLRILRRARLLGTVACRLRDLGLLNSLPEMAIEQLESAIATAEIRARLARWELDRIAWALSHLETIRVLTLKGSTYLLLDLPNAAGRTFADVDLLVEKRDIQAAEDCLTLCNWQSKDISEYDERYYREWAHEIPALVHAERDVEVDIHHNIIPLTARLKPSASRLFELARPVPGSRFEVLCPADIALHAIVHLIYASDFADRMRDLVDIDLLLREFSEGSDTFWDELAQRAQILDLTRPAYYGLRYSVMLLGTPVPAGTIDQMACYAPPAIIVALMDRLVPLALYPQHPDHPSSFTGLARLLLYIRFHWISMPPLLLARHLTYKFFLRQSWCRVSR